MTLTLKCVVCDSIIKNPRVDSHTCKKKRCRKKFKVFAHKVWIGLHKNNNVQIGCVKTRPKPKRYKLNYKLIYGSQ